MGHYSTRAICALAHKLLKIVFLLIEQGECYLNANVDCEEISVHALRWIKSQKKHGNIAA